MKTIKMFKLWGKSEYNRGLRDGEANEQHRSREYLRERDDARIEAERIREQLIRRNSSMERMEAFMRCVDDAKCHCGAVAAAKNRFHTDTYDGDSDLVVNLPEYARGENVRNGADDEFGNIQSMAEKIALVRVLQMMASSIPERDIQKTVGIVRIHSILNHLSDRGSKADRTIGGCDE